MHMRLHAGGRLHVLRIFVAFLYQTFDPEGDSHLSTLSTLYADIDVAPTAVESTGV